MKRWLRYIDIVIKGKKIKKKIVSGYYFWDTNDEEMDIGRFIWYDLLFYWWCCKIEWSCCMIILINKNKFFVDYKEYM